jgi:16S rRNA A1518/A1519 N6-dimethyltransferase RsmA/KsgA/DIM1 with predicted DNA glycosylase/AP lyase activity
MPHSYGYFKAEIKAHLLAHLDVKAKILDVGAGCGTYAKLLAPEYQNIDTVEIFEKYVARFGLRELYRNVYVTDIANFDFDSYDYLIFGDVLEHMTILDAQEILKRINNNGQKCLVAIPYMFEQGESEDNIFETHLQPDLTHDVFLERYPGMRPIYRNEHYGYYCNYEFVSPSWKQQLVKALRDKETIKIPDNYWTGDRCLENGVPWMVPGAIYELDNMLLPSDYIVEFGSGGSTRFFAERCRHVLSVETDSTWFEKVQSSLAQHEIANVFFCCVLENSITSALSWLRFDLMSVLVVDTVHGFDRSEILNKALFSTNNIRMIVLDNYASESLFPQHFNWSDQQFFDVLGDDWNILVFDDEKWHGDGTKILVKNS